MPKQRFTAKWIEALKPPPESQVDYFDTNRIGDNRSFGLRASQRRTKELVHPAADGAVGVSTETDQSRRRQLAHRALKLGIDIAGLDDKALGRKVKHAEAKKTIVAWVGSSPQRLDGGSKSAAYQPTGSRQKEPRACSHYARRRCWA